MKIQARWRGRIVTGEAIQGRDHVTGFDGYYIVQLDEPLMRDHGDGLHACWMNIEVDEKNVLEFPS